MSDSLKTKITEKRYLKKLFRLVGYKPTKYSRKCTEPRVSEIDPILCFTKEKFKVSTVMYESRYVYYYSITLDNYTVNGTAVTDIERDVKILKELLQICNNLWENQKQEKQY